jgi:hypothetical protein
MAPYDEATAKPHHGMIPNRVSTAVTAVIPHIVTRTRTTNPIPVRDPRTHVAVVKSILTPHARITSVTIPVDTISIPTALNAMVTILLNVVMYVVGKS